MAIARSYRTKILFLGGAALAAAVAAGFIGSQIVGHTIPGKNFWLVYPLLLTVFAVAMAASVPWWQRLDDMQKSGQLISWYLGGQVGGVVVLMALVAATGTRSGYSLGGAAVFLGQGLAFGVVWLIWRWRSRGPVE